MYEAPGARSLAVRKSPSMPMLEISIGGGEMGSNDGLVLGKCPSGRKTMYQRKVKSAISLCVGVLLCCIVLLVLVAVDPTKVAEEPWRLNSRGPRMLIAFPTYRHWSSHALLAKSGEQETRSRDRREEEVREAALEGMGMLFRKGTRAMPQLIVAHLGESTTPEDLRLFLRGLHRSGMPSRADVVLLFPFRPVPENFTAVIREEEDYFQKLLAKAHIKGAHTGARKPMAIADGRVQNPKLSPFNSAAYTRTPSITEFGKGPSIWAKHRNETKGPNSEEEEESPLHYGAVVGFDVQELDPDDALSGFLDSPSIHLRRWVCYQILLGMVRHRYRHVMLSEVAGVVILKDVLAPLKKKDSSLHLYYTGQRWSDAETVDTDSVVKGSSADRNTSNVMESVYGRSFWNSLEEEDKGRKVISTGMIIGGIRPVRSVATAMATEIVRVAMLRKNRKPFRVEALLSYLVHKSSVLGRKVASHLQVHESGASSVNLLPGPPRSSKFDDLFRKTDNRFAVIQGLKSEGTSETRRKKILESLKKDICRSQNDLEIYSDCYLLPEDVIEMMIQ
ncbi:hypothetical protein KC19_3G140400 [Ceratodon purpureus]|uniref:DUF7780 domain-containing protein n=1 Tax=Ceratodon purpureus TaxID=3225 RepID=A0A8T0IKL5_CERPU|nr:hypothetical protein KC19_3G140400 [Ceratodon purpureus]